MLAVGLAGQSLNAQFSPEHLAVLRAGDGMCKLSLRQSPIFIDQFDLNASNAAPSFTAKIPTNGADSFFFNGHAATEGTLTRSVNHKLLSFAGYGGTDLLQVSGTASRLNIPRGIATVDHAGAVHTYLYKADMPDAKVNPRGAVTDGAGNFWGCGNAFGTYYFNPPGSQTVVRIKSIPNSRAINIINDKLFVAINAADAMLLDQAAGIYNFPAAPLPHDAGATAALAIPSAPGFERCASFDINPAENVAYIADTAAGVQKYAKTDGQWKLAYSFSVPQTIPKVQNNAAGCFGLVVDFSRTAPVIYATTTEGYGNSVNSNRVIRIVDTNSSAWVLTVAQAGSTNVAFRGIAFTPE